MDQAGNLDDGLEDVSEEESGEEEEEGSESEEGSEEEAEFSEEEGEEAEFSEEEAEFSEEEGEEEDGDEVEGEESGEDDEGEDWETEDEDQLLDASDSDGDEEAEKCPICLNRFREQDVGTPEACDHIFCLECIQEWAKNVNTCPVDRQVFRLILCKHSGQDKIFKRIPVEDRNTQAEEEEEETFCEVCQQSDREDRMLLCDGCDLGYHLECLTPPLSRVPVDAWFCPECADREGLAEEVDDYDEMQQLIDENEVNIPRRPRRQIPRTLVSERVRSAIEEIRLRRTRTIRRIVSSSESEAAEASEEEVTSTPPAASSTARKTATRKKTTRKYKKRKTTPRKYKKRKTTKRKTKGTTKRKTPKKTTRKRKTTGKRKTTKRKTTKRKGRRRRKITRKKARLVRPPVETTVKSRIADSLGLHAPPKGTTIPIQKQKVEKSDEMRKADAGASALSIFGSRTELIGFQDDPPSPGPSETQRPSKYSRLALSSYRPIGRVPVINPSSKPKPKKIEATPAAASASPLDLLGSIMQDQTKLHLQSRDITIQKDGSLLEKPKETKHKPKPKISFSIGKSSPTKTPGSLFKKTSPVITSPTAKLDFHAHKSTEKTVRPSLATTTGSIGFQPSVFTEEYDPAHPTDELEEPGTNVVETNMVQDNDDDKYDPFHPTEELESDLEEKHIDANEHSDLENTELNQDSNPNSVISENSDGSDHEDNEVQENYSSDKDQCDNDVENEGFEAVSPEQDGDFDETAETLNDNIANEDDDKSTDLEDENEYSGVNDKVIILMNKKETNLRDQNTLEENSKLGAIFDIADDDGKSDNTVVTADKEVTKQNVLIKDGNEVDTCAVVVGKTNTINEEHKEKAIVTPKPGFHGGLPQVLLPHQLKVMAKVSDKDKTVESLQTAIKDNTNKTESGTKKTAIIQKSPVKKGPEFAKTTKSRNRLLYGEIDFTADVSCNESSFPQKFEVNVQKIEDAFKDTKVTEETQDEVEIIEEFPDEKQSILIDDEKLKDDSRNSDNSSLDLSKDTENHEMDFEYNKHKSWSDENYKDEKSSLITDKQPTSATVLKAEKASKKRSKRKVSLDEGEFEEDEDEMSYRKELKKTKEHKNKDDSKKSSRGVDRKSSKDYDRKSSRTDNKKSKRNSFNSPEIDKRVEKSRKSGESSKRFRDDKETLKEENFDKRKHREDSHEKRKHREDSHDKGKHREDSHDKRKSRKDSHDKRKSREDSHDKRKSREDSHDKRKSREDIPDKRKSREDSHDKRKSNDRHDKRKSRADSHDKRKSREDSHDKRKSNDRHDKRKSRADSHDERKLREASLEKRKSIEDTYEKFERRESREDAFDHRKYREELYDYSEDLRKNERHKRSFDDLRQINDDFIDFDEIRSKRDKHKKSNDDIKRSKNDREYDRRMKDSHKYPNEIKDKRRLEDEFEDISDEDSESSVDNKQEHWSEIEEGEVQEFDDYWYKEKRKKEKKERKKNKDDRTMFYEETEDGEILYSDKAKLVKSEKEIDTRIVIQVSQNTENRRVWEEDEKRKKKRKKELKESERKERNEDNGSKKERKRKRRRSRSKSKERKGRSKSREKRRSRERGKKKHRDQSRSHHSRSHSRERSHEKSSRKKRKNRERSRDSEREKSWDRSRERSESLDFSEIYGDNEKSWSQSPYRRHESPIRRHGSRESISLEKENLTPASQTLMGSILKQETGEFNVAEFSAKRKLDTKGELPKSKKLKNEIQGIDSKKKKVKNKPKIGNIKFSSKPVKPIGNANSPIIIVEDDEDEIEQQNKKEINKEPENNLKFDVKKIKTPPESETFKSGSVTKENPKSGIEYHKEVKQAKETRKHKLDSRKESREIKQPPPPEEEKDSDSDDEPEETEQFSYTDRDEFLLQNKHQQQHTNLIQIAHETSETSTRPRSPLPPSDQDLRVRPISPLVVLGEQFINNQFPHPPPGPPPGMIINAERPVHVQVTGPPGQGILGEGAILIRGPPPPQSEPLPGGPQLMQHGPNGPRVPVGMNMLPQQFPPGLPQPLRSQEQVLVNNFMNQPPPGFARTAEPPGAVPRLLHNPVTSQISSPGPPLPQQQVVNGPFDGLPPDGPPNTSIPPPGFPAGEPRPLVRIQADTPPLQHNLDGPPLGPHPGSLPPPGPHEPQLIHITSHPHDPRLPIPLHLPPPSTEPPPNSIIVPIHPPNPVITSIAPMLNEPPVTSVPVFVDEPNHTVNSLRRVETPPIAPVPIVNTPPSKSPVLSIPGLGDLDSLPLAEAKIKSPINEASKDELPIISQLEEISKLLNVQAKLKTISSHDKRKGKHEAGVFKVPLPPGQKSGNSATKGDSEINEVTDMDMGSPIDHEGNIELPISPQYENLIDKPEDLIDNKSEDELESEPEDLLDNESEDLLDNKSEDLLDNKSDSLLDKHSKSVLDGEPNLIENIFSEKSEETFAMKLEKLDILKEIEETLTKVIDSGSLLMRTSQVDDGVNTVKEESPAKRKEEKTKRSKENKHKRGSHHHHHHHKNKTVEDKHKSKDLRMKALSDAHQEIDAQELPSSAVEMTNKEKYLKKLHLQERVVEEVKMAIKPHYANKDIDKYQYKEILRKAVPKICHSTSGEINPMKIKSLIEAYVSKFNKSKSKDGSTVNDISPDMTANGDRVTLKLTR